MSMEYMWRFGYRGHKGDPQEVGQEIEAIQEESGFVSAEAVLDRAREKDSVLHPYFEWNNATAAEKYRLDQARYLIRSVAVRFETGKEDESLVTRAFVEIKGEEGPYKSLQVVISDGNLREQLIKQAQHDIEVFENKYAILSDVIDLIKPIKTRLKELVS